MNLVHQSQHSKRSCWRYQIQGHYRSALANELMAQMLSVDTETVAPPNIGAAWKQVELFLQSQPSVEDTFQPNLETGCEDQ